MKSHPIWQLQSGLDRRFKAGHPWVYSNELQASPKGVSPGDLVELRDASGKFLARGFGNPHSLIAFRVLSRRVDDVSPDSFEAIRSKLEVARELRRSTGYTDNVSYRLCFGEADGIPGLVIDHYALVEGQRVLVLQAQSAGANLLIETVVSVLRGMYLDLPTFVLRNDVGIRKLEGIALEDPRILYTPGSLTQHSLRDAQIRVRSAWHGDPLEFSVDLVEGQKTGFFLDQWSNIGFAVSRLTPHFEKSSKIRVLDICSYVGQWGAQWARAFSMFGKKIEVTAIDASEPALSFARKNLVRAGAHEVNAVKGDVFEDLSRITGEFDLVICDPPALIKGRKDLPQGKHAYLQLNTQAIARLAPRGAIVSCSCSALLDSSDFDQTLAKAAIRNSRPIAWIARGGTSPDHPVRMEFPEGRYLKSWIGISQ